ncbi:MAG: YbaL family putative K(+) efflux transporter [Pseudomonadota bacterium]|jgi:Kef-type K+ transport system, predicted NAD-binding component|nr:MAG: Kef family K(+) transporter [Pseudomonadota bacterium]
MPHETALIATIAAAFVLAFGLGFVATRLRLPPLVGYLVAGVLIGPFTPGFVADTGLAQQLAEIGVILLMFGVGLHFSIPDLMAVRRIALPGAIAQIVTATAIGAAIAYTWDWGLGAAIVFGLSLSVASTVVLLRALEQRNALHSPEGRIAIGWLIVEDVAMVLALVLLPALAESLGGTPKGLAGHVAQDNVAVALALTMAKVALFVGIALVVGMRVVPWLLMQVARTGSRELFTLAVLAVALGIAYGSAQLFGVSFALGAFFAGVILSESDLSHQAGADSLPLQDAFAVLFFVSVGMLFDPSIVLREPLAVLAVIAIIMVGKSVAAFLIVLAFRYPVSTALTVSASLAQIGEFSFILAGLGVTLGLLPAEGRDLILAGALLSITLNPVAFAGIGPIMAWLRRHPKLLARLDPSTEPELVAPVGKKGKLRDHAILVGYGRVGSAIGPALEQHGFPFVVVERDRRVLDELQARGVPVVYGDASAPGVLAAAGVAGAKLLVIATPDGFQARRILEIARAANPGVDVVVRTHSEAELRHLESQRVGRVVMGERELAMSMLEYTLCSLGVPRDRARLAVNQARGAQVSSEGT